MCVYVGSIILLEAYGPVVMIQSHMRSRTGLCFTLSLGSDNFALGLRHLVVVVVGFPIFSSI